ncbi:F-box/LRR-repeat protein 7-like isoform X1 [Schistocerca serialis cubense]|uniref:F-box/LRR-repeat protein 7-like isoform X1 n=3 Tax=Schistocerca serialis cubense TaxID=2023355 RepID=UPI00214E0A6D|nr:F-box/LRR-repeat protein 7-like isoform X1 [Schistocerca serialis cubense]
MGSYPTRCSSLSDESEFSSDTASEPEQSEGCYAPDDEACSSSTPSQASLSAVCSGLSGAVKLRSQQELEASVSDVPDSTACSLDAWRVSIDDLPDEILIKIFSHMSFSELVDVIQKVCTRWKRLSQDAYLWSDKTYFITMGCIVISDCWKADKTDQQAVQTICDCPNLRSVCMWRGAKSRVFRALYNTCHRLSELYLHPTQKLSYEVLKNLVEKCPKIHTLRISRELLKLQKFAEAVSQFQHLRVLELQDHFMGNRLLLRPLGDGCPQLTVVHFGFMTVDLDDLRYFLNAKRNSLKSICINWTMERRCILPLLSVCADSLERLELSEYNIHKEESVEAFTALGTLKNLQELKMLILYPAPPGAAPLAFETGGLPKLRMLDLRNGFGLDDETVIAICRGCPALRELNVGNAELLSDAAFSEIYRLQHLEILDVSGCEGLGGALIPCLARLPRLHTLVMEYMEFPMLQPGLSSILQLSSIRCLTLNDSILIGMPFDKFAGKLVNLRELYVHSCVGDSEALHILKEQMPSLKIYGTIEEHEPPEIEDELEGDIDHVEAEYDEDDSDGAYYDSSESEEDSVG